MRVILTKTSWKPSNALDEKKEVNSLEEFLAIIDSFDNESVIYRDSDSVVVIEEVDDYYD